MQTGGGGYRNAWIFALLLFVGGCALTWRRTASFHGDLNREWTTPARVAAGERLYKDVSYFYGPVAPISEAAAFRLFGSRVGTAMGFGLLVSAAALGLMLAASRRFLPPIGVAAVAAITIGVFAFAPENGALVTPYSLAALMAIGLSWGSLLLAEAGRATGAGLLSALALLSKVESAPAVAVALLRARGGRMRFLLVAIPVSVVGYLVAVRGIPLDELIRYGPLKHLAMPPEFRELYLRVSGLHPSLIRRALLGTLAGGALGTGWFLACGGAFATRPGRLVAGLALLLLGFSGSHTLGEPLFTTAVRGVPALLLTALVVIALELRRSEPGSEERRQAAAALGASLLGIVYLWRSILWVVPSYPYAPLAAFSALPGIVYLAAVASARAVSEERRGVAVLVLTLPLLFAPLFMLPRLIEFYRSQRTAVVAPRGTWIPPDPDGARFASLVARLQQTGVHDRSLVVLPEGSALNFLLGVRSPLRLEQVLPGHLDDVADQDAVRSLERTRPERIVWIPRPKFEYGSPRFGIDYARRLAALIKPDYVEEARLPSEPGSAPSPPEDAVIYVRR